MNISCGPSTEEDEDGDGRNGAGSATDEDTTGCTRWRSSRCCTPNTSRRSTDRWVRILLIHLYYPYGEILMSTTKTNNN